MDAVIEIKLCVTEIQIYTFAFGVLSRWCDIKLKYFKYGYQYENYGNVSHTLIKLITSKCYFVLS